MAAKGTARWLPGVAVLRGYRRAWLWADVRAGIVVDRTGAAQGLITAEGIADWMRDTSGPATTTTEAWNPPATGALDGTHETDGASGTDAAALEDAAAEATEPARVEA